MGNTFSQSKIKRKFTKRSKSLQSKRSFRSFKSFKSFKSSKSSRTFSFQSQSYKSFEISEHTSKKNEPLKYYLANYEKDTDIMVIFHFLGCYLFQSVFSAPVEEKLATHECCKVLDVGCGAGTWILNLAATYRTSIFIGIDICTVYPSEIKPDNVAFMQGDTLNGLPYEDNTFDFVHQGNMLCVFTTPEWEFVISELVRVCKPGGYIEFTEPELASNTGPILTRFYKALIEHSNSRNVEIRIAKDIIKILKSLPTVRNVEYKTSTVSLGYTKGGNAGQAYFEVHDGFFLNEPMPDSMHKIMGLSKEEYLELFNEAKKEVNNGIAPDCDIYRIWCQKV